MQALLRYPGAKWGSAEKIISYFPEHKGYLEPYFGSGAILFNKEKANLETINDTDKEVINFFQVLKNNYQALEHELKYTPYAKDIYIHAQNLIPKNNVERAYKFFVMSWMSHGGYQPYKTGWSHSKNPVGPNKAMLFKNVSESLYEFSERLKEVQIENDDAIKLMKAYDFEDTLVYLDPPYVLNTRKSKLYKFEMSDEAHIELLETVKGLKKAKVLISGYDNELYNEYLSLWNKDNFKSLDGCGNRKNEVVWFNYDITQQVSLFDLRKKEWVW